jgi:hypothetical protein
LDWSPVLLLLTLSSALVKGTLKKRWLCGMTGRFSAISTGLFASCKWFRQSSIFQTTPNQQSMDQLFTGQFQAAVNQSIIINKYRQ